MEGMWLINETFTNLTFYSSSLPNTVNSSHLSSQKELIVTSESTKEIVLFEMYLKDNGV